jgi:hypothetical protein
VANYKTSFLALTNNHQEIVLNKFIGENRGQELNILNAFGVQTQLGLTATIKTMGKATLTNLTMQAVGDILNDPNQTIILDNYFSDSALSSSAP